MKKYIRRRKLKQLRIHTHFFEYANKNIPSTFTYYRSCALS